MLEALKGHADIVVLDCPPVIPVADAAVLAERVEATLLVVTAGLTRRRDVSRALEVLRHVDAPVAGLVLNGVSAEGAYGYYYSSRYSRDDERPGRKAKRAKVTTPRDAETPLA